MADVRKIDAVLVGPNRAGHRRIKVDTLFVDGQPQRERTLNIDGAHYYHIEEAEDGAWVYVQD